LLEERRKTAGVTIYLRRSIDACSDDIVGRFTPDSWISFKTLHFYSLVGNISKLTQSNIVLGLCIGIAKFGVVFILLSQSSISDVFQRNKWNCELTTRL